MERDAGPSGPRAIKWGVTSSESDQMKRDAGPKHTKSEKKSVTLPSEQTQFALQTQYAYLCAFLVATIVFATALRRRAEFHVRETYHGLYRIWFK